MGRDRQDHHRWRARPHRAGCPRSEPRGRWSGHRFFRRRLRDDPRLVRDLRIARAGGIAPRRLWGWEPEEVHVEEIDEAGRKLVRVTREPEFDQEQYELLAALE